MGLAEQMSQSETEIEGGIAPVNDLMIEQNELSIVDEDVLGTVVTVDERQLAGACCPSWPTTRQPSTLTPPKLGSIQKATSFTD